MTRKFLAGLTAVALAIAVAACKSITTSATTGTICLTTVNGNITSGANSALTGKTINVTVGEPFYIDLQRFDPKPGSAWLNQFDATMLTLNSSGFAAQYEAAGVLWWPGSAQVSE